MFETGLAYTVNERHAAQGPTTQVPEEMQDARVAENAAEAAEAAETGSLQNNFRMFETNPHEKMHLHASCDIHMCKDPDLETRAMQT